MIQYTHVSRYTGISLYEIDGDEEEFLKLVNAEDMQEDFDCEVRASYVGYTKATIYEPSEGGGFEDLKIYYNDIDITKYIKSHRLGEIERELLEELPTKYDMY